MTLKYLCISVICTLVFLLTISCSPESANQNLQTSSRSIELMRDTWGVPHIFSNTDAGAMYGLGYASAEDRAFQMYYNLRIIQGRLAELVGDVKIGVTERRPQGRNSAVRSDIKMRTIGYYRAAQKIAANLDNEILSLLQAYSDGVNDYINNHPNEMHYLFGKLNLEPELWTPAACIASWWRLGLFFSGDGLREAAAYYEIKDGSRKVSTFALTDAASALRSRPIRDDASVIQREDVTDEWVQKVMDFALKHNLNRKVDSSPPRRQPPTPKFSTSRCGTRLTSFSCHVSLFGTSSQWVNESPNVEMRISPSWRLLVYSLSARIPSELARYNAACPFLRILHPNVE